MAYRIHERTESGSRWLELEGRLDGGALADVLAFCKVVRPAKLVLRAGTDVSNDVLQELLGLRLSVVAESPFLAHWLETVHGRTPTPKT